MDYRILKINIPVLLLLLLAMTLPPCLAKELPIKVYPYRASITGIVRNIRKGEQENDRIATVFVTQVFLKDEMFDALKTSTTWEWPTGGFANFSPQTTRDFELVGNSKEYFGMPESNVIGKEFLWCFNPIALPNKLIRIDDQSSIKLLKNVSKSELDQIKNQVKGTAEKWTQRKAYMQKEIEKQWSPSRIEEFIRHPDARLNPTLQSAVPHGHTVSSVLYPERKDLGKITWYATFFEKLDLDAIELHVNKEKNQTWRLYPVPVGEAAPNKDQELCDLLTVIAHNAYRSYPLAHVKKDGSYPHLPLPYVKKITRKPDGHVHVLINLENKKQLELDLSPSFEMTNILVDGKPDQDWSKAFKERFKNLERILKEAGCN